MTAALRLPHTVGPSAIDVLRKLHDDAARAHAVTVTIPRATADAVLLAYEALQMELRRHEMRPAAAEARAKTYKEKADRLEEENAQLRARLASRHQRPAVEGR